MTYRSRAKVRTNAISPRGMSRSTDGRLLVERLVANAHRRMSPYDGKYEATWLLSDWTSSTWITTAGQKTRMVDVAGPQSSDGA